MRNENHTIPAEVPGEGGALPDNEPARTLSEYEASPASRRVALIVLALSAGMFLALLPFAATPVGIANWFIPLYQPVVALNDIITATLLFGYLRLTRKYALLVLACGYLFSAVMAVAHLLTFPSVFAPTGLLGAGPQTTGYMHVFWHCGFPISVIAYAKLKDRELRLERFAFDTVKAVLITLGCAALLIVFCTLGQDLLPQMLNGAQYSSSFNIGRYGQWVITGVALVYVFTRRSTSTLDLWMVVVLAAWFFEIGLVSIFNAGRWDVGFYAGRGYALVASSFVLVMLLLEHVRMYRDLAEAQTTARLARKLTETREVLRLALVAGRMGVFSWDLRSNRAWWSQELEHMVGMVPGTMSAEPDAFMRYVYPEDHAAVDAQLRECIKRQGECELEFRMRDAKGELLWAFARAEADHDEEGRARTVFGIIGDITERKRAEAVAAELDVQFQTMANEIPQIAWMSRPDGWIYWFNRRLFEYTGLTQTEVEGWAWERAIEPKAYGEVEKNWRRSLTTGDPFEMVLPIRGADGIYRPFLTRAVPMKNAEGRIVHWFGTNTDITAQNEAEQALKRADQLKDEFLATLAHELRNPLAPIRNATELLSLIKDLPPNVERALAIIDRQSRHLTRLVDDLLEVSRITQGKVELRRKSVSLVDCLSDALHGVESALKSAGLEVTIHLPEEPLYANADATRIVQCFVNLLNNAIKFTPRAGFITVSAERTGNQAQITIADSGIGIAPDNLGKIFGLFAQLTPVLERTHGGLGIGLSLVKGFVELHGGTVSANSEGLAKGSSFVVRLPLMEAQALAPAKGRAASPALTLAPRRVLVVDDNLDAAACLVQLLASAGHDVREAHDGPEGLRIAFDFEPEVILLDIGMPGMSGLDVARELRRRVGFPAPRIIAVTGWGQERDRKLTSDAGFDFHLTKPVNHTELDVLMSLGPEAAGAAPPLRH